MAAARNTETTGLHQHRGPLVTVRQRCLVILREYVASSDIVLTVHAAEGLTEAGYAPEVRSALSPRFVSEANGRSRCLLARELYRAGDLERLIVLTDALHQSDVSLQIVAAESLYKLRELGDSSALRRCLSNTSNEKLQLMIYAAFACQGDQGFLKYVRDFLSSPAMDSRKVAAWILTRLGAQSDISLLRERRQSEGSSLVRAYIDHALAALHDAVGIDALLTNLRSSDTEIRQMAADSAKLLQALPDVRPLDVLLDDPDPDVRIRAAHALLYRNY